MQHIFGLKLTSCRLHVASSCLLMVTRLRACRCIRLILGVFLIGGTSLIAQPSIKLSDIEDRFGASLPAGTTINHSTAAMYQDIKRSVCYMFSSFNGVPGGGSGFLINTVSNCFSTDGNRRFYIATALHILDEMDFENTYISFNYEMADALDGGDVSKNSEITRLYKIPLKLVVQDAEADLALLEIDQSKINLNPLGELTPATSALYNAYALGWSLQYPFDLKVFANISHPKSDIKKSFTNQKSYVLANRFTDPGFLEFKLNYPADNRPETGSSGSPLIDSRSNRAVGILVRGVDVGVFLSSYDLEYTALENSWRQFELNGGGLINYLDPGKTWMSTIPGGYIKDLLAVPQTDFDMELRSGETLVKDLNYNIQEFFSLGNVGTNKELILGSGLNLTSGAAKVFFTVAPRERPNYLLFGAYSDASQSYATDFNGIGWNLLNSTQGPGRVFDNQQYFPSLAVNSTDTKTLMVKYLVEKSRLKPYGSFLNFLGFSDYTLAVNEPLPVTVSIFRTDDGMTTPSMVRAVKLPHQMPCNAVELFDANRLANVWQSKRYPTSGGRSTDKLFINTLTVSQDAVSKTIATGNNGGYLNLVNPNFLVKTIKTSYKEGSDVEDNHMNFKLDVANNPGLIFYYKVWMDFFPDTDASNHYNFVADAIRHETELLAEGSGSSSVDIHVKMPDNVQLQMTPGQAKICRLRIAISYQDNIEQDGVYADGEVEDYLVEIRVPERKTPEAEIEIGFDGNLNDVALPASQSGFSGIGSGYDGGHRRLGSSSLRLGGNADFVSLDDNDLLLHKAFSARTISLWLYCESNTGIQDIYDEGDDANGIGLRINNGNLEFGVQNANSIKKISGAIPVNQWVFVTGVFNNGKLSLYVDGTLAAANTNVGFTSVPIHAGAAGLGATNGTNAFDQANNNFNGWVDELKIYNVALLESEIEFLSGSGTVGTVPVNAPATVQEENKNAGNLITDNKAKTPTGLIIYPNPSKGDVNVITEVKQAGPVSIQIIDMQGRVVYEKNITGVGVGFQQVSLRNINLKAASYIVKVESRGYVQTGKLVVEN
ncbi:MAG: LamG-like jellyroll fold domain-containing protein [Bacteroidota bacterium]